MPAEYKVTFIAVSDLAPDLVQRAVRAGLEQSGLARLLRIERIVVGPPWNKHRPQLRREGGALEFREVPRPPEPSSPDPGGTA